MKIFAIGLLIGNVILLGWQFNDALRRNLETGSVIAPLPPGAPTLKLLAELDELPPRRKQNSELDPAAVNEGRELLRSVDLDTETNDIGVASNICVDIGPLVEEEQLKNLRAWLRTRATTVHTRLETVRERRFFWVVLEPTSQADAQQKLDELKRRGVEDYMLIGRGEIKNAISLGLFRSQDSVNRRLAEMTRQGYKPVVVPKFETTNNYYVQAIMVEGAEDADTIPAELYGDAIIEANTCNASGGEIPNEE